MSRRFLLLAGMVVFFCSIAPAYADPCKAPLPARPGVRFSGTVQYVGDGDGLCVGRTADPNEWIEVRLADFDALELHQPGGAAAKAALERIALHRKITCTAERGRSGRVVSFDRIIAPAGSAPTASETFFARPASSRVAIDVGIFALDPT